MGLGRSPAGPWARSPTRLPRCTWRPARWGRISCSWPSFGRFEGVHGDRGRAGNGGAARARPGAGGAADGGRRGRRRLDLDRGLLPDDHLSRAAAPALPRRAGDAPPLDPGRPGGRRPRQPRAGAARRRPAGRPLGAGPRRRRRQPGLGDDRGRGRQPALLGARRGAALHDREGLDHRGRRQPDRCRRRRRGLLGDGHPAHSGGHVAGVAGARQRRQPGGGRLRKVRGKARISGGLWYHRGGAPMTVDQRYKELYPELDSSPFATVDEAVDEIRAGRMVVVVDSPDRENEGDLVMAAECVTPEAINFMATHARGLICLTLTPERCDALGLPMMTQTNRTPYETAFTVSIEARDGVSTGISAADRAHTIRVAVDPASGAADLVQPGHVFPLRARPFGVLERTGQTEASVD